MPPRAPVSPQDYAARWAALKNIGPFLALVWAASPALSAAMLALRLMRAVIPVAMLWLGKLIIDEVIALHAAGGPDSLRGWWEAGLLSGLAALVAAELALAVVSDLLGRLVGLTDTLLQERLVISLSTRLMDHAAALDLADFEDAGFQDRLDRARRQTMGRIPLVGQLMGQMQDLVTVLTFAGGLLAYNPWLVVILAVALIPAFLGEAHFNAALYALNWRRTQDRRERDYLRMVGASAETAKEVKIFGLAPFLRDRYLKLARGFYAENRRIAARQTICLSVLTAIGTLGYYATYVWILARVLTGDLTIGDMTFLAGSFLRLRGLLESLLGSFSATAAQAMYLDDLFGFFREVPRITSAPGAAPVPQPIAQGFEFRDVGFRYPGAATWAVRGLSFTLNAGETLALVGENGAGKTTLVKLLARLYDPDEGQILLDGRDLRSYDLASLRAAMGVIFQDFVRYNLSAADNIAVGQIEARADAARIETAASRARADRVIGKLARGYEQILGKRFSNGVELSGGEWQKLAIARGYMRQAQVLILDEPTAALDARSEFEVFERFRELSQGKTAVLISHRFSSVRMADRILVLENGRVEASGSHEALLAQGGRYRELFELQAAGYR